ncbi:Rib/alpha-like domain-containing protein [Corynebacterium pyruviciproducens]|uniref:Rib/alpha-like domain-containing protein n=1 Tax=Corynebacterium pyruviciproducens TaxID=598660 RepID=A0AAF1BS22_9CORY|nr:Rib/alpha-like domain-containing protein [Corynebacterium pyruviciproducens]WOT02358.1 Rib/alpha-like domain-containing protein [Corynebacterium pyruviciproducens]
MTAIRNQRGVRRGISIAAAALSLALVAPAIQPVDSQFAASVASAQDTETESSLRPIDPGVKTTIQKTKKGTEYYLSPGNKQQDEKSVSGKMYLDVSGEPAKQDGLDVPLAGKLVLAQWRDYSGKKGGGRVSPVYGALVQPDGTYVIKLPDWTDELGTVHDWEATSGQVLRVWTEDFDPEKYMVGFSEFGGDWLTPGKRQHALWNGTIGKQYVERANIAIQERPETDWLALPEEQRVERNSDNGGGSVHGTVFRDYSQTSGTENGIPIKNGPDTYMAGEKIVASYLRDEVVEIIENWKKVNSGFTFQEMKDFQKKTIADWNKEHPDTPAIAETVVATSNSDGYWIAQFNGLFKDGTLAKSPTDGSFRTNKHINYKYMYVYPEMVVADGDAKTSEHQTNMRNFGGAYFSDATKNIKMTTVDLANHAVANVLFATHQGFGAFDIREYNMDSNPAAPGDTATAVTTSLDPERPFRIDWFINGVKQADASKDLISDKYGNLPDQKFKVPEDTPVNSIVEARIYEDGVTDEENFIFVDQFRVGEPAEEKTDADNYDPKGKDQSVETGSTPKAEDSIENLKDLPKGTTVAFKDPVDTKTPGDKKATVVVTYPDGSSEEVPVTVKVADPKKTDAETYDPKGKDQSVETGSTPKAEDSIENLKDLPKGTTVAFKDPVDTKTPGDKKATVVVTYPDGSSEEVPVTVKVADPKKTDAETYDPKGKDQSVETGSTPKAEDSIENLKDLPKGTTVAFKDPVDTKTPGDKKATVVVTYPDGSSEEVPVTVKVADPKKTDAETYDPKGKDQSVETGSTPKAEDSIENLKDLPKGTTVAFKDPVDTKTPGDKKATVVVTYPDGSSEEVPVTVKVADPKKTDAETYDPKGKDQSVETGSTPKAEDSIENLKDLPKGTTVAFKDPVDTKTPGDKKATVVVTYPDGSSEEVPVTVKVADPKKTDAETYDPKGKDQSVETGSTPKAEDSIENLKDLPKGTTVAFKDPVDTKTPGDKKATVVVTYPDGSSEEVPVTVKVADPKKTDAETYDPKGKDQSVETGSTPKAEDSIENLKDLPKGTTVAFKDPVDTKTPGDKKATVVVTYPDGSSEEVPVTVKVADPKKTDAETYDPKGKDQSVETGSTPKAEDSIENLKDLPKGTTVAFKDPVDTKTPGDKKATVVVTYPDGSTDEVTTKINVKDPDKVTPPTIIISNDEKTISGKTDPGAEVTVTIPGVKDPVKVIADENGNYKVEVPEGTTLKNGDTVKVTAKVEGKGEASNSAKISKSETSDSSIAGLTQNQANKCVGASAASAIPLLLLTPIALGLAMDNQQVRDLTAGFGQQLEDINTGIQKTLGIYNPELAQQFKVQVAPHLRNLALAAGFVASIALLAGVAADQCVPGGGSSDNTSSQK